MKPPGIALLSTLLLLACGDASVDGPRPDGGAGPPPKLGACDGLAAAGSWQEITPPEVKAGFGVVKDGGGAFAFAIDPVNQGTVYLGTLWQKVWKTTDCGATWTPVATGKNAAAVNTAMNWTFAVDPIAPEVVYTNSGYSQNGLLKSKNGGVDWDVIWPPPAQPELSKAFTYNFANVIAIDPDDHLHLLLTFHEACLPPHPATCIAESKDGGDSWRLIDGHPTWNGNEGQVIFFLGGSATWLWGSSMNGFWRGTSSGASWEPISGMTTSHLQGSQLHRTKNGVFFMAAADGFWRSPDGQATTWKLIPNTGPIGGGLVSDGTNMYGSNCYAGGFCTAAKYFTAAEANDERWSEWPGPKVPMGGSMAFEKGHRLLYSSNMRSGIWRVVVP